MATPRGRHPRHGQRYRVRARARVLLKRLTVTLNFTLGTAEATPSSSSASAAVPNYRMSSHEEHSAAKHAAARGGRVWRQHNAMHLSRVYPAPARVDPSNYLLWSYLPFTTTLLTAYYLLTTYYLLLTTYYLLLTTYY